MRYLTPEQKIARGIARRTTLNEYNATKRARLSGAQIVELVTYAEIREVQGEDCYLCGRFLSVHDMTFDHIVPLVCGGNHTRDNLRLAHRVCNSVKGRRLLSEITPSEFESVKLESSKKKTRPVVPLEVRFWAKVDKTPGRGPDGDCWLWTGAKRTGGHGLITINNRTEGTHRLSYELAHGSIPEGMVIRHKCDVGACVNPAHLIPGTQQENIADRVARGRCAKGDRQGARLHSETRARGLANGMHTKPESRMRGSANGNSKLSEEIVLAVRNDYPRIRSIRKVAAKYGISASMVQKITSQVCWQHI